MKTIEALQAACESAKVAFTLQRIRDNGDHEMRDGWTKLIAQCDAAIAKAKGA